MCGNTDMNRNRSGTMQWHFQWIPPGQRIVRTASAVTLCLLIDALLGYGGGNMPAEAAITAVICLQPYVRETRESGFNRLWGTVIGAIWGFLFLLAVSLFPAVGTRPLVLYPLMGLGTLIALHSAVLFRRPEASGLAAIVFICVVISWPEIGNPLEQAFLRILDVLLGTAAAILTNSIRLPRVKQRNKVFFVPMESLTGDRFTRLSAPVMFRLQRLMMEGAKLCLMSQHAPAFQTTQLGIMQFNVPMIVMDGAAIYDPNDNVYTSVTAMNSASCRWLMKRLEDRSFFIYTVHRDRNCIFHHGELTELEKSLYSRLKKSPYRYYLDDDRFSLSDVVYIKLVTTQEHAHRLQRELEPALESMKLRSVLRTQPEEESCSLYFYPAAADMLHAKEHLMQLLRQNDPLLEMCDMTPEFGSRTAADGVRMLQAVAREYEPSFLTWLWRKRPATGRRKNRPLSRERKRWNSSSSAVIMERGEDAGKS